MEPYAEVGDLCCDVADQEVAERLILRASRIIVAECGDASPDPDAARDVCAAMVERALPKFGSDAFGASQSSMAVDSISQSWTWANPSGDLYITEQERRILGCGGGCIGFAAWGAGA